jgi:hypothetical protein
VCVSFVLIHFHTVASVSAGFGMIIEDLDN